ncbi:hypothetical protein DBZ36_03460 [Alginatibacterium sediminis]|uniref:Uncharacterized protein n=1 Tax=Alginatibacterium sediminis TaxID=2164068 RepID=A0A420EFS0_9ALTE|nr:alpha/beta hydrolase YcfP [Alginatibacterium sediminis]RKF19537.1 hypothetical protein DBZ36_03460 [Alginatibacterium sediminis]
MIFYLHGFDSTSPGNHEKVLQLQFSDPDVRSVAYSTIHPRHDMSQILKQVHQQLSLSPNEPALITGVGLGGYWSERIGFLCGIPSLVFNPNLHPELNMQGRIERPEEYSDIAGKCISNFRHQYKGRCHVVLSRNDDVLDNTATEIELSPFYSIIWDEQQSHKFKDISAHLALAKELRSVPSI